MGVCRRYVYTRVHGCGGQKSTSGATPSGPIHLVLWGRLSDCPRMHPVGWVAWPVSLKNPQHWDYMQANTPGFYFFTPGLYFFYVSSGDWTQVQQALCQLSWLPYILFICLFKLCSIPPVLEWCYLIYIKKWRYHLSCNDYHWHLSIYSFCVNENSLSLSYTHTTL